MTTVPDQLADGLSDGELFTEYHRALAESAEALKRDPATMAYGLDPAYVRRPHLDLISRTMVRARRREVRKILITTPPQVGKSVTAAVWTPFWWMANEPATKVIVSSYGSLLAIQRGRAVRKLVLEHGAEFGLRLDAGSTAAHDWSLESGGGMRTVGIGGSITGHSADLLIIDDPVKSRAEADSVTFRDATDSAYRDDLASRLAPDGVTVLIMTRWHEDDVAGRLLEREGRAEDGGEWTVIHLPAVCDLTIQHGPDPLGRSHGDPLPHPRIPVDDREALERHWADRKVTARARGWGALYQGDPKPVEGALLTDEMVRQRTHLTGLPEVMKAAVAVDPGGGGRDTVGIVGGFLGTDRRLYWTHDRTAVMPSTQWPREVCRLAAEIGADRVVMEANFGGDMTKTLVRTAWVALLQEWEEEHAGTPEAERNPYDRLPPRIELVRAKVGKLLRADPIAQQVAEDRARFGAVLTNLEGRWTTWQPADPDSPGELDAAVYLAYELLPVPGMDEVMSRVKRRPVRVEDVRPSGWAAQRID
ncbi:terminase large subunit domain-containing protein [Streptomyces yaizuensis]|uniref:Terminase family protein n=1 Tax=Streptomyces yaizuensis TaxID=2989713 RepID=A0AA86JBJ2_9ACTN|nr:terminase family protein [Streptomyces sp. YSPA8]BDT39513.1 terminase family protein [Streptomyces sp. YSPA8]